MTRVIIICFLIVAIVIHYSCSSGGKNQSPKFQQYYVQGEELYKKYCVNCHQADGTGLGKLYPPLNKSDFMDDHFNEVVCIVKYGKKGTLTVNGVEYNMEMKGNPQLTELEVAEIVTYIYNSWSRERGLADVTEVTQILSQCDN